MLASCFASAEYRRGDMTPRLIQSPASGERKVAFVGDHLSFELCCERRQPLPTGWRARLRTNLGRAAALREELITAVESGRPATFSSWRDISMERSGEAWTLTLPLAEVGYFKAKAYALDEKGWQHWPEGPDFGVSVQPAWSRTANTIYCAFPRMFGPSKAARTTSPAPQDPALDALDRQGYTVIPPSGKLRDLIAELPHIIDTLGCRILHLLPVNPTPTTYARFGRFGSPYAGQDLLAIDPALVTFDKRTTGVDQFRELAYAVHARGARLFLDMAVNHTGWGSTLLETHPEWFVRHQGQFVSPGAWGTVWEDLVELDHSHQQLRRVWGEAFVEWCRRGVDGFRCDAGYKVPLSVWQYIIARVRQEFPDTVFLLEGLGGAWETTELLLTEGGMQWAYSELFQNYSGPEVRAYLDYALTQSVRHGLYAHYSETHDNPRLAQRGAAWSLLRNRLCALTSTSGAFGFTNGVEWLAAERVNVHSSRGLSWGNPVNLVTELGQLNRLLAMHPCFFDGARLTRLSPDDAEVYALLRESADRQDAVLVLVNTDSAHARELPLNESPLRAAQLDFSAPGVAPVDLMGQAAPVPSRDSRGRLTFTLPAASTFCLATSARPTGLEGDRYRHRRALETFALEVLCQELPAELLGQLDLAHLGAWVERDAAGFIGAVCSVPPNCSPAAIMTRLESGVGKYPRVITWRMPDRSRVLPVPFGHWVLVRDTVPFRVRLELAGEPLPRHATSTAVAHGHVVALRPHHAAADARLVLERYGDGETHVRSSLRFLSPGASAAGLECANRWTRPRPAVSNSTGGTLEPEALAPAGDPGESLVLLTNGRGGMARLGIDFGAIRSKYDCLLGANLHRDVPVDRHVFVKRARVWINADGFLSPLDAKNLDAFAAGPPARWSFLANAGDGRAAEVRVEVAMLRNQNITILRFVRPARPPAEGRDLPDTADVRLTVRLDIEDRNFHWETKRNGGADHHFASHTRADAERSGFVFAPGAERQLRVWATDGRYHPDPEWSHNVPHPVEASRGMEGAGDAFSPGWFELPLPKGASVLMVLSAEKEEPSADEIARAFAGPATGGLSPTEGSLAGTDSLDSQRSVPTAALAAPALNTPSSPLQIDALTPILTQAARAFVVRRDDVKTVIAGYPWFLDWGRDTLICARGLLAAGWVDEVLQILKAFGRFESQGTLPNSIHGNDATNRDTSDAPLWFGVVCEDLAGLGPVAASAPVYATPVDGSRSVADVLQSIAAGYLRGTPNGIRVDPESGLVFSPSHFTWMDTNHPAATPRAGYPVEIQALWIRLLRQLARLGAPAPGEPWAQLAERAATHFEERFWLEEKGWYADVLLAGPGEPARQARAQDALRSNALLPICLGVARPDRARRTVAAAQQWLVIPGGLRSLAPLRVTPPLPVVGEHGCLLNDPSHPYWGRYEGDENTRRKPAYHNGTAWTWTFPHFGEALALAWDFAPEAVAAARSYLGSVDRLLAAGCMGHMPEILDGDAPHAQRGCDAQAWSVTESLRVWLRLRNSQPRSGDSLDLRPT